MISSEDDLVYDRAAKVVTEEFKHIRQWRGLAEDPKVGLALSGGGIRSASFCLGVLQALAHDGKLKNIDYLSTVSGGGYIGASLTYLLHQSARDPERGTADELPKMDVSREHFPYGTYPMVGVAAPSKGSETTSRLKGRLLRRLRQNASYLAPGGSISVLSLSGVLMRNLGASVVVHAALLVLAFGVLFKLNVLTEPTKGCQSLWKWLGDLDLPGLVKGADAALRVAGWGLCIYITLSLVDLVATHTFDRIEAFGFGSRGWRGFPYRLRRFYDRAVHWILVFVFAFGMIAVVGSVGRIGAPFNLAYFSSSRCIPMVLGFAAVAAGLFGNVWAQVKLTRLSSNRLPTSAVILTSSIVLILGVLLLAYLVGRSLYEKFYPNEVLWGSLIVLGVFGWLPDVNYVSMHRYYRDRLMELFMPDLQQVRRSIRRRGDDSNVGASLPADATMLGDVCRLNGDGDKGRPTRGPYHLINANVVLVASKHPRFRGRGGDNFLLSPLYCGSRATGWVETDRRPGPGLTLATAMAISGAAFNPNAGPSGEGFARQPVLSVLLGMLNLRLGYWHDNPSFDAHPFLSRFLRPNLIWPGLLESFGRSILNENNQHVLLTDGGHFENLGLYELVRRRLKLIVVCDGTADPKYQFGDLANAIEKIRADFGVIIEGLSSDDLATLVPGPDDGAVGSAAQRGYLIARIRYSRRPGHDSDEGVLVLLKSTVFPGLSADLVGYRRQFPDFPNQSTSDQFFDERQFEAYRELGFQTAMALLSHLAIHPEALMDRDHLRTTAAALLKGAGCEPIDSSRPTSPTN